MTILVTGAGGFIGSHLTEALVKADHHVRALIHYNSRGSWGHLNHLDPGLLGKIDVRLGDIADPYMVRELVAGCEFVLHLAALIGIPYSYHAPASYVSINIGGTLNILEACRQAKVRRLIVTSTSEVYGTALYTPIDELHPLQAQSPYSASKIAADKLAQSFFCSYQLPVVTLRPFNTYGPRQSARAIIPTVLSQALAGIKEIKLGNLAPQRDLTYVDDTVNAFLLALDAPGIEGETIHFGQGNALSVEEIGNRCLKTVGSEAQLISTSERQRPSKSEVNLLLCNPAKAKSLLQWIPRVGLDEGLLHTADYLRKQLHQYQPHLYSL
jgi:NAD dependent epimerase/dehydratase